jgi:hypothetical protein
VCVHMGSVCMPRKALAAHRPIGFIRAARPHNPSRPMHAPAPPSYYSVNVPLRDGTSDETFHALFKPIMAVGGFQGYCRQAFRV